MIPSRILKSPLSAALLKIQFGIFALAIVCMSSGCRNCGWNPYGNPGGYPGGCNGGQYGYGNTVPAPPTYSLNGLGQNQPYYNNAAATAQQPSYLINPNGAAPTPAYNSPSLAPAGWRPTNGNNFSQLNQPSTHGTGGVPGRDLAASMGQSVLTGPVPTSTGLSQTSSINYATTAVDERRDDSRLPVSDASQVRAPTVYNNSPRTQLASASFPGQANPYNPAYANQQYARQQQFAAQPGVINGRIQYGQPVNVYNGNVYPAGQLPPGSSSAPALLASATTTYDPVNNPNYDNGWRNRDLR